MPPRLSWSKLLPGLMALAVAVMLAIGVLLFAGVGAVRGDTVRVYVLADNARGVMPGTEVWLFGQKVGVVEAITFRRPSADTTGRVVIAIDVRERDAMAVKRDAPARIGAGANVIGPVVVHLGAGAPSSAPVRSGDTLRASGESDLQLAGERLSAAAAQLPAVMTDARTIVSHVQRRHGTLGALLSGDAAEQVHALRGSVARVRPAHAASAAGESMAAARTALARADSIRTLLRSGTSSVGRFRRDSTLPGHIASVRDELASLRQSLAQANGSLPRWRSDSAMARAMADVQRELTRLLDDVRRRPFRYFPF